MRHPIDVLCAVNIVYLIFRDIFSTAMNRGCRQTAVSFLAGVWETAGGVSGTR